MEDKISITLVNNQSVKYKKTMHYSAQTRDQIFVKGQGFFFAINIGKNVCKNITKNLSGKCS